ncbi:MAG: cupin domain-containing protein [Burkholderiaceae bacterium]
MEFLTDEQFKSLSKPGLTSVQLLSPHNSASNRVTITRVTVDAGAEQSPHAHPSSEQIWVAVSGSGLLLLGADKTKVFGAGEVARFADGEIHGFKNTGKKPFIYLSVTSPPVNFSSVYDSDLTDISNFKAVSEKLATSGQPTEKNLEAIAKAGYQVVINLGLLGDPRYSLKDEKGLVTSLGMTYIHIPVNFTAPKENDLQNFIAAMDQNWDRKVFIHCADNKRVTAFLGLYLVIQKKWSVADAFLPMKEIWEPDGVWSSFISATLKKHGHVSN